MRNYRNLASVLTVLLLVGIGAGCENAPPITGPADQAPQFAPGNGNGNGTATRGRPHTTSTPVAWNGVSSSGIVATLPSGGGTLQITDGETGPIIVALHVPGGATPGGPVLFSMELVCDAGNVCEIELHATRDGVDASDFRKDVELHINRSYLDASVGAITIAESHGDGSYTPIPTREVEGFLIGRLQHFSGYVPITD